MVIQKGACVNGLVLAAYCIYYAIWQWQWQWQWFKVKTMTLIVLGHEFKKTLKYSWGANAGNEDQKSDLKPAGIFAVAESAITAPGSDGLKTIIGGFRKIYPIAIKVWEPHFVGVYFHNYHNVYYESECFVAIAGSTLTAQHALNTISEHLRKIRISYKRSRVSDAPGKYILIRHCQSNELERSQGIDEWDEDMFTPNDYINLISADDIASIVGYSINEALSSARKYKLDRA